MAITPAWAHKRPAPRKAPGPPPFMPDKVTWTRTCDPREKYRIVYRDRDNALSERVIELLKVGSFGGQTYYSVLHAARPKTLRADRIVAVLAQLSEGHAPTLHPQPTYASRLPSFPVLAGESTAPVLKVGAVAAGSNRTWTVDLGSYTCTCPEKRLRVAAGYEPGLLGYVCPHMARAIITNLPTHTDPATGWTHELLTFLNDPRKVHIDNLT